MIACLVSSFIVVGWIYALVSLVRATVGVEDFFIIRNRLTGGIFKNIVGGSIGRPPLNMGQFPRIDDPLNAPPPVMAI